MISARLRRALVLLSLLPAFACAPHFELARSPGSSTGTLGPLKRCAVGASACTDDRAFDTSQFTDSNTKVYPLPQCAYGIDKLIVPAPGSSDAIVQCAAPPQQTPPQPDGGIPTATLPPTH